MDVIAGVSILQSRIIVSEVKDRIYANRCAFTTQALQAKVDIRHKKVNWCASLQEDKFAHAKMDYETVFDDGDYNGGVGQHGGIVHVLHANGTKAKRVSYPTFHAETLSMIGGVEASTSLMVRLSEIMHPDAPLTLAQLTKIQEEGNKLLPVDYYGDCRDVFELVTGFRTLLQDWMR